MEAMETDVPYRIGGNVLNDGLIMGMDRVGKDFKNGELFVPEVLIAARAMHAGEPVRVTGMQGLVLTVEPGRTETSGG